VPEVTRPNLSPLVLDGDQIKLRLMAERTATGSAVHIDWLRFTVQRRNTPAPSVEALFPEAGGDASTWERIQEHARHIKDVPDCDTGLYMQALELAQQVTMRLGAGCTVKPDALKGHDFYKHRLSIERNEVEIGWVGFGTSSDSPRQAAQARTLHVNLYGAACTFSDIGWNASMADLIDELDADITRCDLALDFFEGFEGGIERTRREYNEQRMNVNGRKPKCNYVGDWSDWTQGARSFYFGSKEAGKQTNVYEKGDQLYGVERESQWLRVELRWGNKLRVLPSAMLRRPADFFACASDWHAAMLAEAGASAEPEQVELKGRAAVETVKAEAYRVMRHVFTNAGPCLAALIKYAPQADLNELANINRRPSRLQRFSESELYMAFAQIFKNPTAEGTGPSFA
jgi:phage replication initiation protein